LALQVPIAGASDDESADEAAASTKRGQCGQFVWPCPRQYHADLAERKRHSQLKPEDLSKEEFVDKFREAMAACRKSAIIQCLHCFDEPHKRFNPQTDTRERHTGHCTVTVRIFERNPLQYQKDIESKGPISRVYKESVNAYTKHGRMPEP
jgi:hypothetical protein